MISYLKGVIADFESDKVIIEVNGIGYNVFMPLRSLKLLGPVGSSVKIHTYLNVREDAMLLFGFNSKDELNIFKLILNVSGIGPKGALSILSQLSPDDLRFAVVSGDINAIAKAPGIGKKSAQKLILELNDKINLEDALNNIASSPAELNNIKNNSNISEAIEALEALGFSASDSLKAINNIPDNFQYNVEELIKKALKEII